MVDKSLLIIRTMNINDIIKYSNIIYNYIRIVLYEINCDININNSLVIIILYFDLLNSHILFHKIHYHY